MRVAIISHSCVVPVNQQLFVALARTAGVDAVELLVPENWRNEYDGAAQPSRVLPEVRFPVHRYPVWKPGHVSLHCYRRLPTRAWRDFRPDVLYAAQEPWSLSHLQAVWLSRRVGIPLVFHTNQNILKRYPPPFSWFEQLAYRRASVALAYSEEARQVLLTKGLTCPSEVVPYPVELSQFFPDAPARLARRAALGIGANEVVLGYLGRFVPDKGLDTLVRAVAAVEESRQPEDPPLRVLMVGAGAEESALRGLAAELGVEQRFLWTGLVPHSEAGEYMRCIDVFVLPSITLPNWKEQFGRVIIEAMACEVPVVGSDSGQIPHLIRETGGGLVFPEKDSNALAAHLRELLRNPEKRRDLGVTGREAVARRYRTEAVAEQLVSVFRVAISEAGRRLPEQARAADRGGSVRHRSEEGT